MWQPRREEPPDLSHARGKSPQAKREAQERLAVEKVGKLLQKRHGREIADPLEVLVTELSQAAFSAAAYGEMVGQLDKIYGPNHFGDAVPHVLVSMQRGARPGRQVRQAGA